MIVGDALAGKTIKCSGCGNGVKVPGAALPPGAKPVAQKKPAASPAIYISTGKIIAAVLLLGVVTSIILFFAGPVKVWHQWEDIGPKASDNVKDVISFGLQAYMSTNGYYDPGKSNYQPGVTSDILFYRPLMVMSMPEKVKFEGISSEGPFSGWYNTQTDEIEADVGLGAHTVGGLISTKPQSTFHLTGSDPNHQPQAECNGQPMQITYPKNLFDAK
jgi:hypothetical protein